MLIVPSSIRLPHLLAFALVTAAGILPSPGFAQEMQEGERPFFLSLGYGHATYSTTGRASVAGQPLDGARVALGGVSFAAFEAGWRFAPNWSVSVLGGLPPTVALHGRGDFAAQGVLRKVTYGSVMFGAQYYPFRLGRFEPVIGAGISYTAIFRTRGGSMSELNVADNAGPYVQLGGQFHVTESVSAFLDARKTWLSFDAKGVAGGAPVRVGIDPDPISVTMGLTYRF